MFGRLRLFLLTALCALPAVSQVVALPGITPVGTDAPAQRIAITLPAGGTPDSLKVLTDGVPELDFTATDNTCLGQSTSPGQTCWVTLSFHPHAPGQRRGAIVVLDRNRAVLASRLLTAQASGAVLTFLPGTIDTIAGDQAWIYSGDSVLATQSAIFLPFGIAVDAAGNLFLTDSGNNRIRRVDAVSGMISTLAGTGVIGFTGDGGPATAATLANPTGIALDPAGNLFFADAANNAIRRIDAISGVITTVATHLSNPNGLVFASDDSVAGSLLIADTGNHMIRKLDLASGVLTPFAGRGTAGATGDGGPALAAAFNAPWSVTLAPSGDIYIADQNNHRIRKIDALTGLVANVIGTGQGGFSGDGGPASLAQLDVPASVALDVAGNLYIADSGNNRIRKISAATGFVSTIAGNSGESISGDSGPADQAGLYGPYTLALDSTGSLLIADVFHNRIRRVAANTATLDFPAMRVGRIATAIPQTLENDGNAPLHLSAFTPVANAQLDPVATTCKLTALAPLAQCIAAVQFAPTVIGEHVAGLLNLVSDAANSPGIINLRGKVLNVDPATITLVSGTNPSTTGTPVTFSVTVTSDGATPTGTVTLLEGTTTLATAQLMAGGVASFTLSTLTGGQHQLTASYAGDPSNSAAVSTTLLQLVKDTQAATATTLSSSASPINAGASLRLTAVVSVGNPAAATGPLTGNIAFKEGLNTLGTAALVNGQASLSLTNLSVGTHILLATFTGSSTYAPSDSANLVQVVNIATSHLVMGSAANPSIAGAALTLTALITSTGGTPTGSIQFMDNALSLGKATIDAQGNASLTVPGAHWTPGNHTLTTFYPSDGAYTPAAAGPIVELISVPSPALTLTSSLSPAPLGGVITFTGVASSSGAVPTGQIQLLEGATVLANATLNPTGTATFPITTLPLGTHILHLLFAGDVYNGPATSPAITQVVEPTAIALTLAASANPTLFAASVTFSAQTSATGAIPTGKVSLLEDATTLATATLDPTGLATLSLSTLAIGPHKLTVHYAGDSTHAAADSATLAEQVLQVTSTTLVTTPANALAGTPITLTAHVTGVSGKPITGTIIFSDGAVSLGSFALDASGNVSLPLAAPAVGAHTFLASYPGDPLNAPSAATPVVQALAAAITATTVRTSANPSFAGTPLTLTARCAGNGAAVTGTITFLDGTTSIGSAPIAGGSAQITLTTLRPGNHALSATCAGDAFNQPSTSPALTEQIAQRTAVALTSSANPSLLTDTITFTVTVANGVPATPPTGFITLTDGGQPLATLTLVNGVAAYTISSPSLGVHTLLASYAGDPANTPATSAALVQTVTLRPTTTSFTASTATLSAGQPLVLVSVVQGNGSHTPTGSVSFQSGSTVLGTAMLDAGGIATLTLMPAQAVYTAVAVYSGDTLFAPSTSPALSLTVNPTTEFTMIATPPSLTLQSGSHATLTIGLTTAPTFKDTLALGCAGLPAFATCVWSENQIAVGGGLPHTLTVVVDTGNPLGAGPTGAGFTGRTLPGILLGTVLALLLLRRRFKARPLLLAALLLGAISTLSGCGTSFTQQHTPAGSYTFNLIAEGAATGATQKTTIVLKVTP